MSTSATTPTFVVPTPAVMAARKPVLSVPVDPSEPAAPYAGPNVHDGAVKAKALKRGQQVRPLVRRNGQQVPMGALRTVDHVERIDDGAEVRIFWSSPHSPEVRPAAYRFFDEALVGMPLPDKRKPRRKPKQTGVQIAESLDPETKRALELLVESL